MRRSELTVPQLLIADAGATHTRALIVSSDGQIRGRGNAGPGNAFAVGNKESLASLQRAFRGALTSAKVSASEIAAVVVGSASVDLNGRGTSYIASDLRRHFPSARRMTVSDCEIALEGALAGTAGVVIVSGTGSVVLGKTGRGRALKVGGWGPLFGDEGSAQWVAREGLRLAAHGNDKTGPPTSLTHVFKRHFRLRSFSRIIEVIYRNSTPATLGALAPLVAHAAVSGDRLARAIFSRGGDALAAQAAAAIQQLHIQHPIVSYQGSMFLTGKLLLNPLKSSLRRTVPPARLVPPVLPPIGGAYLMASQLINRQPNETTIATFLRNFHV